jgi:hypothetical protein
VRGHSASNEEEGEAVMRHRVLAVIAAAVAVLACSPPIASADQPYYVYAQMGSSLWRGTSGDIYNYGAAGHTVSYTHVSSLYAFTDQNNYIETGIVESHDGTGNDYRPNPSLFIAYDNQDTNGQARIYPAHTIYRGNWYNFRLQNMSTANNYGYYQWQAQPDTADNGSTTIWLAVYRGYSQSSAERKTRADCNHSAFNNLKFRDYNVSWHLWTSLIFGYSDPDYTNQTITAYRWNCIGI